MRIVLLLILLSLLIVGVAYGSGANNVNRRTVRSLDLERYMGTWFEIARFDHAFERGLSDVVAAYRLLPGSRRVEVVNSGCDLRIGALRTAYGKAYATSVPGRLKVSFFWFFYSEYNVLELDDDYEWALVGGRSPKYLWILARTPELPASTLHRIVSHARRRGYKTEKLLFIDQSDARP